MLILLCLATATLPEQALSDRENVARTADEVASTYYFDLGHHDRDTTLKVLRFALASLSRNPVIERTAGARVGTQLLRVDLRDLGPGWEANFPSALVADYPYSQYRLPLIVRADWFIQFALDQTKSGQLAYQLLTGKPIKTKDEFFRAFAGVAADNSQDSSSTITITSGIALNSVRLITSTPARDRSSIWQTYDFKELNPNTDPLENLGKEFEFDAQEVIASIPKVSILKNLRGTLQVYGLFNADGANQAKAPTDIVVDSTNVVGVEVVSPISCMSCHTSGLNPLGANAVNEHIRLGAQIYADADTQREIERDYLVTMQKLVDRQNEDYRDAVSAITDESPKWLSENLRDVVKKYQQPVTLEQVSVSLGVTVERLLSSLVAAQPLPARLAQLAHGQPIARTVLEREYEFLINACERSNHALDGKSNQPSLYSPLRVRPSEQR